MADELQLSTSFNLTTTNLSETFNPGTITIDVSSVAGAGGIQAITAHASNFEQIAKGDAADGGVFFIRNIDTTNFVEVGTSSNDATDGTFQPFLKLLAGEFAVGRLKEANIFARADTANVNIQYRLLSP